MDVHNPRHVFEHEFGGIVFHHFGIHETVTESLQRGNDDALAGVVVIKRKGTTDPGSQYVLMTVDDLTALLTLERP